MGCRWRDGGVGNGYFGSLSAGVGVDAISMLQMVAKRGGYRVVGFLG